MVTRVNNFGVTYGIMRNNMKKNSEWLRELRAEKDNMKQNDINISTEMIKRTSQKDPKLEKPMTRWTSGLLAEEINII